MKKQYIGFFGLPSFAACKKLDQQPESTPQKKLFWYRERIEVVYQFLLRYGFSSQKLYRAGCHV
jgi:hypothetical protein